VLLLTGLIMDGTEAAAEFVEHAVLPQDLSDWLRSQRHYAELLVHTKGVSAESWKADLVAYRKLDAAR
jgi:hypothetical protein